MQIAPYGMKIRLYLFVQPLHVQGQGMENGEKAAGRTNSVASAVFSRSSGEVVPQAVSRKIACKKAKQIEAGSVDSPLEAVQTGQKEASQGDGEQAEGGPQGRQGR